MNRTIRSLVVAAAAVAVLAAAPAVLAAEHKSTPFQGPKANKGFVTHSTEGGKSVLTLSPDFVIPDTPDPHWQLVDSKGNTYLMQKLSIKGDKTNLKIEVPSYVKDVQKVVIWCAFAEVNLGEASFSPAVK